VNLEFETYLAFYIPPLKATLHTQIKGRMYTTFGKNRLFYPKPARKAIETANFKAQDFTSSKVNSGLNKERKQKGTCFNGLLRIFAIYTKHVYIYPSTCVCRVALKGGQGGCKIVAQGFQMTIFPLNV
jgi:hypothetical protein